ncbi:hypothetical protein AB0O31_24155 [Kitasatospora cineracea]|uniref:hypothetical protein n=1 Tax=Kitasatospora cineracea TaxID=88074 RepID=UPI003435471C
MAQLDLASANLDRFDGVLRRLRHDGLPVLRPGYLDRTRELIGPLRELLGLARRAVGAADGDRAGVPAAMVTVLQRIRELVAVLGEPLATGEVRLALASLYRQGGRWDEEAAELALAVEELRAVSALPQLRHAEQELAENTERRRR